MSSPADPKDPSTNLAAFLVDLDTREPVAGGALPESALASACEPEGASSAPLPRRQPDHLWSDDPGDLRVQGWDVVVPQGRADELFKAMEPLIALRSGERAPAGPRYVIDKGP